MIQNTLYAPRGLLFGNGYCCNTPPPPNQFQPLSCTKDYCAKNSEGLVN